MSNYHAAPASLPSARPSLLPAASAATLRGAALVTAAAACTAAAAQVSVPLPWTPVPFSLQTMAVLLSGAVLGARLGASAQVVYLLAGIAGLPVFAAAPGLPAGAARLLGPTGGFLLAFPFAAAIAGACMAGTAGRGWLRALLGAAAATAVIYAGGTAWLAMLVPGGVREAAALTLSVLGPADLIKTAAAAAMAPAAQAWVGRVSRPQA